MLHIGCTCATTFTNSGKSLLLTSAVALQPTMTCSMVSLGKEQRTQAGLKDGLSFAILSLVR